MVEPFLPLQAQSLGWSILFIVFGAGAAWHPAGCDAPRPSPREHGGARDAVPPSRGDRAMWLLSSASGSGLLLAATNQLCQDIAVVPLLWIVPLTFYLLTFIVCFAGGYRRADVVPLLLAGIGGAAWLLRRWDPLFRLQARLWRPRSSRAAWSVTASWCASGRTPAG